MKTIGVADLQELIAKGGVDIIDVREPNEWATGHVPGARHVPLGQLEGDPAKAIPSDDVVFVCAKGGRSARAAKVADGLGRQRVYSVDGGTEAWARAGLAITLPGAAAPAASAKHVETEKPPTEAEAEQPMLDALVGVNLRRFRDAQGWTLDQLAGDAGISRTLLGQIEIGRAAPSIGVVWKLAQSLGVPFAALLSTETRAGTTVTHRAKARKLLSADGRFSSRALFPLGDPSAAEFYELWLAPHSREDADAHRPGTRENLVVTAGTLELHIGRDVRTLVAGDAVVFCADVAHSYVNPSRDECWMYLVMNYARV